MALPTSPLCCQKRAARPRVTARAAASTSTKSARVSEPPPPSCEPRRAPLRAGKAQTSGSARHGQSASPGPFLNVYFHHPTRCQYLTGPSALVSCFLRLLKHMGYGARFFKITKAAHEYTGQQLRQPVSTQGGDMSRSPLPCWPSRASGQGCSAGGVWGAGGDGGAPAREDGWQCGETESPARARLLLPRLCVSPDTSLSRILKEVFTLVKKKKYTALLKS